MISIENGMGDVTIFNKPLLPLPLSLFLCHFLSPLLSYNQEFVAVLALQDNLFNHMLGLKSIHRKRVVLVLLVLNNSSNVMQLFFS